MKPLHRLAWPVLMMVAGSLACSSTDDPGPRLSATINAVSGASDAHCGARVVVVDGTACKRVVEEPDAGSAHAEDEAAVLFGAEGDDDQCKYRVRWSAETVAGNASTGLVLFRVTFTNKVDGSPVVGGVVRSEVFLDETTPGPNTGSSSTETADAGTYIVGPVGFDRAGRWTVRFHINDQCNDFDESPHGHLGFAMDVDVR